MGFRVLVSMNVGHWVPGAYPTLMILPDTAGMQCTWNTVRCALLGNAEHQQWAVKQ